MDTDTLDVEKEPINIPLAEKDPMEGIDLGKTQEGGNQTIDAQNQQ